VLFGTSGAAAKAERNAVIFRDFRGARRARPPKSCANRSMRSRHRVRNSRVQGDAQPGVSGAGIAGPPRWAVRKSRAPGEQGGPGTVFEPRLLLARRGAGIGERKNVTGSSAILGGDTSGLLFPAEQAEEVLHGSRGRSSLPVSNAEGSSQLAPASIQSGTFLPRTDFERRTKYRTRRAVTRAYPERWCDSGSGHRAPMRFVVEHGRGGGTPTESANSENSRTRPVSHGKNLEVDFKGQGRDSFRRRRTGGHGR